jgi:hypothetical protein
MALVATHSGGARRGAPAPFDARRMLQLVGALALTFLAWGLLVGQAIDFGGRAHGGQGLAWVFLFFATVGAAACLFVTLILAGKIFQLLRGDPAGPPSRRTGGHRAR